MSQNVAPELMAKFRERMKANGINPQIDFPGLPVSMPHAATVPFTGNVHIPQGRVAKRSTVDRIFSKLKF